MSNVYNLFISHSWTYGDQYNRLVALLDNRGYFAYKNFSVPKDDPVHTNGSDKALYEAIKRKMSLCHVVIILAGVYSTYSRWINKEIQIAKTEFGSPKPILAIEPWGSERASAIVKTEANLVVGWNTESVVAGIRKLAR